MGFFAELKRRNVVRMAGLYLVGAWLIVQVSCSIVADAVFEVKAGGGLVLIELHPGVTLDDVRARTGAPFDAILKT